MKKRIISAITVIAIIAGIFTACSEGEPSWNSPTRSNNNNISVSDEQIFTDYIEYNAQRWAEILAGLEQDDFTAWLESKRFMHCTAGQTVPPLKIAQNAYEWWSNEVNVRDFRIKNDYGTHSGYRILVLTNSDMEISLWGYTEVAGYRLAHNCCQRIFAYDGEAYNSGGAFHDLRDAYEAGLLSQNDISAIYNAHFKNCPESKAVGE
jgi:hypothetical protein